jgi:AcrR family transcriptional regulator
MPKHNKKYKQIISTSKELFWKYGIKRVTVEEICKQANVSKMTFYKFFDNKNKVVRSILDDIYEDSMADFKLIVSSDKPYKEKVTEMAMMKLKGTQNLSHEFLKDYYSLPDWKNSGYLKTKTDEAMKIMIEHFKEAQKVGDIRRDVKPEFILYFLNHMLTMAGDEQLNSLYPNAQEMVMELLNFFFYGVLPRENEAN